MDWLGDGLNKALLDLTKAVGRNNVNLSESQMIWRGGALAKALYSSLISFAKQAWFIGKNVMTPAGFLIYSY